MARITTDYQTAMSNINITGKTTIDKFAEMVNRMTWDANNEIGQQLDSMQAHIYGGRTLKSYNTLVAYYDGINVYELGQFSRTTSAQVTRFAKYHGANVIRINNKRTAFEKLLTESDRESLIGGYTSLSVIFSKFF